MLALNPFAGISSGGHLVPKSYGRLRALDNEHVAVRNLPPEAGLLERLVDRLRVLVEHHAQAVQGGRRRLSTENIESVSVMP
jgi:hypothetical protein